LTARFYQLELPLLAESAHTRYCRITVSYMA
jgi:hypothetical protein